MPERVIFGSWEKLSAFLPKELRYALVTDTNVEKLHGKYLEKQLQNLGFAIELFSLPPGEEFKTRRIKEQLEDALLTRGFGRDSALIALGGGVVMDIAGFVAATYLRGIPLFSLPTTLLAMVDASIGGKRGVNTSEGKNLIGAFYFSSLVLIDSYFLDTLAEKEWRNGTAEMIKYGLIASPSLFEQLEKQSAVSCAIEQSVAIKQEIVALDFQEKGVRHILNFGHTFAHALEKVMHYRVDHGEAVALGLACESFLSWKSGLIASAVYTRILSLLMRYGFVLRFPKVATCDALLEAMARDKKALAANARFVLLDAIGSAASFSGAYCTTVSSSLLRETYDHFAH